MKTYKKKFPKEKNLPLDLILLFLMALSLTLISVVWVDNAPSYDNILLFLQKPFLLFLNFLPIFLSLLLIYFVTTKVGLSFLIVGFLINLMGFANQNKLIQRDENLRIADLFLVKEAGHMVKEGYDLHFFRGNAIIFILTIIVSIFFIKKYNDAYIKRKTRIVLSILILISPMFLKTIYFDSEIFNENKIDRYGDLLDVERTKARGLVYPFINSWTRYFFPAPDGYDKKEAEAILSKYPNEKMDKKPHIILMLGESYNNLDELGVELKKDAYASFNKLKENSIYGRIINSVYGGGTIHTERSVAAGYIEHTPYVKNKNTFAWLLKDNGYDTISMHPFTGKFYNRKNTNKFLGLEPFLYEENYFEKFIKSDPSIKNEYSTDYFPDRILFGEVVNTIKNSKNPTLNMTVTMQNHGPYRSDTLVDGEFISEKYKDKMDTEDYNMINNYLAGIKDTGDELLKMTIELNKIDEPVILIFYGDHNPRFKENGEGFSDMGVNVDQKTYEGFKNYYSTPYIIWANDAAREEFQDDFTGYGGYFANFYLFATALDRINVKNDYIGFLMDKKKEVPIFNTIAGAKGEEILPYEKASPIYDLEFKHVEYYMNTNFRYEDIADGE
ncbi:LTA synthase family protein [Peptoniphilus sp.]|jgi:hypothetical protein|uniref:LTA synthase family protein n=1 Tax=Peptoniphilus sp. TaxID=1971214 RepID=UPI003D8D6090